MNREKLKKLLNTDEGKELVFYLKARCEELNHLDDITLDQPFPLAVELKARQRAYQKLSKILAEVDIDITAGNPIIDNNEFVT